MLHDAVQLAANSFEFFVREVQTGQPGYVSDFVKGDFCHGDITTQRRRSGRWT
jgi:hypothetical protein